MDLGMEDEKPPPYVQYHCSDASVTLVQADQPTVTGASEQSTRMPVQCDEVARNCCNVMPDHNGGCPNAVFSPASRATADVTNLNLLAADNRFITVIWDRPEGNFDFYLLDVTVGSGNRTDAVRKDHPGSCANGTIIGAKKTQVTCGPYDACSSVSVTVRTFSKGPPERTSMGTTLKDVFITGKDPSEPRSIAMVAKTPHTTRILWKPPTSFDGTLDVYKVKVCKKLTTCDEKENLPGCVEREVSDEWVDFDSTEDTSYCVFVSASTRCGGNVLTGPAAAQEVRTPLFEHRSPGVTVKGIFIPAEDPNPPTNVTMIPESPLQSALRWGLPDKASGTIVSYIVNICRTFGSCDPAEKVSDCAEQTTTKMWTVFDSKADTSYCILIAARIRCGVDEITSRQVAAEVRTPLFDLPDVTDFRLLSAADSSVTVAWRKPDARFDYYWVSIDIEGNQHGNDEKVTTGSCENGTILHPDTTQVTCTSLKACARVDITLALPDVTNLNLVAADNHYLTVAWDRPQLSFDFYWLDVTGGYESGNVSLPKRTASACGNGTIIRPQQTQITCGPFDSCSSVDVTIRTYTKGPPELMSTGTTLSDVFIGSEEDTTYCILITANARCGLNIRTSLPATLEFRTPLFELPDVTNLALVRVKRGYVTLSWQWPKGRFDYYSVEVTEDEDSSASAAQLWHPFVRERNHHST
ncbi:hypothetical protein MTO96_007661 [Rhipicephalus appendiculatus]